MSLSGTCTRSSTPPRVLKTGCVASSAARGKHHGRGDISGSPWAAVRSPRPPACPRGMSCRVVQRGDPPAARSDIHLHAVFIVPLLRNLRRTHKKMPSAGPSHNPSGSGWETGPIRALGVAGGTWTGGGRKPSGGRGMLLSTRTASPATRRRGTRSALFQPDTFNLWDLQF